MSRYWNDSDWSDYEGEFVGWGLLSLLFILARLKSMNLDGLSFVKKSLVDLIGALLSLAGGWFLCFVIAFFLSCINLDWFFNRDQQQINKVDWICHRKQHFGHKLAHPRNRLLCHFIPPLHTPSPPSGMPFFLSIVHPFFTFSFVISVLFPLVAVAMARHAKLSPSASCMTGPYVRVARALTENYRGALYLTSYHLQFYTQLTLNRLSW